MKVLLAAAGLLAALAAAADPLALMAPRVTLSTGERRALGRGETVARALPARDGQMAVFAATRIDATPDLLVDAAREIADLEKSTFVLAIRRFSDPPRLSDLDELVLADRDVTALAGCQPRRCSFKLTAPEIDALVQTCARDGATPAALTAAFRRILFDRVIAYRAGGLDALPPIANRREPNRLGDTLAALQTASPWVLQSPPLDSWLRGVARDGDGVESFLYWSQEVYGRNKPVVLVTDVGIVRHAPGQAVVVGKQVFASRYLDGALALTAVTTDAEGVHYLTYLNRSRVDFLGGFFGGLKRAMLEARLADEVPVIISKLKDRLERSRRGQLQPESVGSSQCTIEGWSSQFADRQLRTDASRGVRVHRPAAPEGGSHERQESPGQA
jgi:hypothetical protein